MPKRGEHKKAQNGAVWPCHSSLIAYFPNSAETSHDHATISKWLNFADQVLTATKGRKTA